MRKETVEFVGLEMERVQVQVWKMYSRQGRLVNHHNDESNRMKGEKVNGRKPISFMVWGNYSSIYMRSLSKKGWWEIGFM